jgi:predicted nucleotide-binding protein
MKLILPSTLENCQLLAYSAYKELGLIDQNKGVNFVMSLFHVSKISDNYYEFNRLFHDYFISAINDILIANPEIQNEVPEKVDGSTVFIIHGHDDHLKTEVQLLMYKAAVKSFVLHEVADKGRHTLDKLIEETKEAGYAIALLRPDDLADEGKSRTRQNVILEIGYFLGRLGKARVRMIVKEEIDIPSDLHGVLYQRYDQAGAWKSKLVKEMQAVGIFVDMKAVLETI